MDNGAPRRQANGEMVCGKVYLLLPIVRREVVSGKYRTHLDIDRYLRPLNDVFPLPLVSDRTVAQSVRSRNVREDPLELSRSAPGRSALSASGGGRRQPPR
jgi:hypothetical protein